MTTRKQSPQGKLTAARILTSAVDVAKRFGVQWITRDLVSIKADVRPSAVSYHWGSMLDLKRAVFAEAVRRQILPLIAQGLADGNEACRNAPAWLREKAANWSARRGA